VQATDGSTQVRAPASAYNGITVGRTTPNTLQVHSDSATAFTLDGRMKPDLVAPGTGFNVARHNWEGAAADWVNLADNVGGCSLAVPMVSGMLAQQLEGGQLHGLSTDPLVVKATIMNSAAKVKDKSNAAWQPHTASLVNDVYTATRPLDDQSGAGQIDGAALAEQYLAGEMGPGLVESIGWDLSSIGGGQFIDYVIDPNLMYGSMLTTTLTWYRHVTRTDGGVLGVIDAGDTFTAQALSNLNLQLFRNGDLFAESISALDNVEHLQLALGDKSAQYTLRVLNLSGTAEQFALAWHGVAVPEPAAWSLALLAAAGVAAKRRRR
jgi:MYXO-CTERM domain-containing protein